VFFFSILLFSILLFSIFLFNFVVDRLLMGGSGASGSGDVQIFVKTVDGKTIAVRISLAAMVLVLRKMLEEETGKSMDGIRISYASKDLNDMCTLESYGVEKGSNINLLAKGRGGMDWREAYGQGELTDDGPSSDSDDSGRSWATSELPSPRSDDEEWAAEFVRRKKEIRASGRQHRRHHKERDAASSSTDPIPQAPQATPTPVSGKLTHAALQVMQLHQCNQAAETLDKTIGSLQEGAKEAIRNTIEYCKRKVNEVPIIASIQGHVEEVNGQLAGMQHDINVVDGMNNQRHTQTMAIATHILEKQRAQDRRLAALERKVKALPKKKASPKKNAIKKAMKKVMKKATPKKKAMKKHSHV
jgi:hypothetical protein